MIKLILNPYEGVGNIKIGMTKDDISNVLNITPKTFMKSEDEFVDDFKMMSSSIFLPVMFFSVIRVFI